jgi:cation diffusion facilitator family transporter
LLQDTKAKVAGWISVGGNVLLTVVKVTIGLWAGSQALFADGIHSAVDIVASIAALSALSIAYRPPDESHPYGHGKAEDIASILVAVILFGVALGIIYDSALSLLAPPHPQRDLALYIAILSLAVKEFLYRYTKRLGKAANSPALLALAEDHRTDIWGSWAAVTGIGFALAGQWTGMEWMGYGDAVAGMLVAVLILVASFRMGIDAIKILMEHTVDEATLDKLSGLVQSVPGVKRIDRIRGRSLGHYILVDVRVSVDGHLTIQEGHDIIREIKAAIVAEMPQVREVLVHLNPYYAEPEREPSGAESMHRR